MISRYHYILVNDDGDRVANLIIEHPIVANQTLTLIRTDAPRGNASSFIDLPGVYLVVNEAHRFFYLNGREGPTKIRVKWYSLLNSRRTLPATSQQSHN